ncbi:MAG: CPBP family intramembrane metalloprotease [Elusimicrobia bacterium]|nr:CPBP family intramembrane metalloprotease [Elusimicrobiota bacterium]
MRPGAGFKAGLGVLAACLLFGWAAAVAIPLRSTEQWYAAFTWGALWRTAGFAFLLWSDRGPDRAAPFDFGGMPHGRAAAHGALMLGLWSLLLHGAGGGPWTPAERSLGLLACLTVGLFEEQLFRGVLLHGLRGRWGDVRAALGTSLMFMLYHTRPQSFAAWPHILLTGAVFAGLRLRGMSLGHLALIHAAADALFFFHGRQGPSVQGPAYWLFLTGLFLYAVWALPPSDAPRHGR